MIRIRFRASFVVVGCVRGRVGGDDARAIRTIHASVSGVVRLGFFEARARGGEIEDAGKARRLTVRKT